MPPEDNPADDVQPTEEEWDDFEQRQADCLNKPTRQSLPSPPHPSEP